MTHKAPAKRWSLFSHMVSVLARTLFSGHQRQRQRFVFRTDVPIPYVKIMNTYSAVTLVILIDFHLIIRFLLTLNREDLL